MVSRSKNTILRVLEGIFNISIFVKEIKTKQHMNISIYDYSFEIGVNSAAMIQVNTKRPEPNIFPIVFSNYDAVVSGIELGIIPHPEDMDKDRIGYEHPAFSASVREDTGNYRMQYYPLIEVLKELSIDETEAIIRNLAMQREEISQLVIQELI